MQQRDRQRTGNTGKLRDKRTIVGGRLTTIMSDGFTQISGSDILPLLLKRTKLYKKFTSVERKTNLLDQKGMNVKMT